MYRPRSLLVKADTTIIGAYSMGGSLNPVPVSGVDTGLGHCPGDRGLAVKTSMVVPRWCKLFVIENRVAGTWW